MTYPIIPELYGIVARKLLDEIGEKSFYSGSFLFDYGSKECRFVASIVIYRSKECLPEGDADRIDDLVPSLDARTTFRIGETAASRN